jgi:signal transduction histidine kinase
VERDRVFNLFYRGAAGAKIEGTGVGLASVQKIAKLYGGKAWVEETPGGGCTFLVEMADETA